MNLISLSQMATQIVESKYELLSLSSPIKCQFREWEHYHVLYPNRLGAVLEITLPFYLGEWK